VVIHKSLIFLQQIQLFNLSKAYNFALILMNDLSLILDLTYHNILYGSVAYRNWKEIGCIINCQSCWLVCTCTSFWDFYCS